MGIAADNVTGVDLTVDGADVPVTVETNAAFAELPVPAHAAQVVIHDAASTTKGSQSILTDN